MCLYSMEQPGHCRKISLAHRRLSQLILTPAFWGSPLEIRTKSHHRGLWHASTFCTPSMLVMGPAAAAVFLSSSDDRDSLVASDWDDRKGGLVVSLQ